MSVPAVEDASSAKKKRYDRQLRLWGEHGQAAMEECSVCLLNGTAVGAEALKNLVLPGIGSFTIVDGALVKASDLGNNFFVEKEFLGTSRAACVTQLLQELNEHVTGAYVSEDISQVLESRPDFLKTFGLVIATQLPTKDLRQVATLCEAHQIPLIVVHTYGFLGYLRSAFNEHPVVEAHPQHEVPDTRVLAPPPALLAFIAERFSDLTSLSDKEYAHIPYVVLLVKAAKDWASANGGGYPKTYKEKKEIRNIVEGYRRIGLQADQNIDEALSAVNTAFSMPAPKSSLAALFVKAQSRIPQLSAIFHSPTAAEEASASLSSGWRHSMGFWCMTAAVAAFVENEGNGMLPVIGTIPDMTADTNTYVALQTLYQQQAAADMAAVQTHLAHICTRESLPSDLVSPEALKIFCKNAHNLELLEYKPLDSEYVPETVAGAALNSAFGDEASSGDLYVLLRAAQAFRAERSHWPGCSEVEADVPVLKQFVNEVLKELALNSGTSPVSDDMIYEFCRWGGSEMHNIASVMGGVTSQEAIKAVTHQYVPLNNTFIFNGTTGTTSILTL